MTDQSSRQWFHFGPWVFDIQAADELLRANPHPAVELNATAWARAYGLDSQAPNRIPLLGAGPDFDRAYALTTDLTKPLLIATLQPEGGQPSPLLIDGCHRLYHASARAIATLPAHVLTVAESLTIREDRRAPQRR